MTDNEIMQALEHCYASGRQCTNCPCTNNIDCVQLEKYALDLINRQKAENEKLTEDYNNLIYEKDLLFDEAEAQIKAKKSEIKEWKRVVETWLMVHEKDKAEIKKLQTDNSSMQSTLAKMSMGVAEAKAEAIKEFAEKLKMANNSKLTWFNEDFDNLVKEMVGDTE